MPFKTTVNWLFNDIWCYLVTGCFGLKINVFQQTVVTVYYILKILEFSEVYVKKTNFGEMLKMYVIHKIPLMFFKDARNNLNGTRARS